MNWKQWFFISFGIIVGPVLLMAWQAFDYTVYHFAAYRPNDVSVSDLLGQHTNFSFGSRHYAFDAIGAMLGGLSGGLLAAWQKGNLVWVRRVVIFGALLSIVASCVTISHWDFQSGVGYIGAPATVGLWAARIFYNVTVKWSIIFIIAGRFAIKHLARK